METALMAGKEKTIRSYAVYEMEVKYKKTEIRADAPRLASPGDCVKWFRDLTSDMQEKFIVIYLDARNKVICCNVEFSGGLVSAAVYVAPVARHAILCGAAGVILLHNHPSGCVEASEDDRKITKKMAEGLELFEVKVLDHIIVGGDTFKSFAESGLL